MIFKNCLCRKKIIHKLVEECSGNIYENETLDLIPLDAIPLNVYRKVCNSFIVYMILFVVFLVTIYKFVVFLSTFIGI